MRISLTDPKLSLTAIAAFAIAGTLIGCGSHTPTSTAIPQGQVLNTVPGSIYPGGIPGPSPCFQGLAACVPASQFEGTCRYVGGYVTNRFSAPVCILTRRYNYATHLELTLYYPNQLPIITPSIPSGGVNTGIRVRKGAQVRFFPIQTGKWGYITSSTSSIWGGALSWTTFKYNCKSVDWDGMASSGQVTHENQPAGLFGSDGVESFYLGGSSTRTVSIKNDGTLRLGINADPSTPNGCTSPGYPQIDVTTCEDASGNSYNCGT